MQVTASPAKERVPHVRDSAYMGSIERAKPIHCFNLLLLQFASINTPIHKPNELHQQTNPPLTSTTNPPYLRVNSSSRSNHPSNYQFTTPLSTSFSIGLLDPQLNPPQALPNTPPRPCKQWKTPMLIPCPPALRMTCMRLPGHRNRLTPQPARMTAASAATAASIPVGKARVLAGSRHATAGESSVTTIYRFVPSEPAPRLV